MAVSMIVVMLVLLFDKSFSRDMIPPGWGVVGGGLLFCFPVFVLVHHFKDYVGFFVCLGCLLGIISAICFPVCLPGWGYVLGRWNFLDQLSIMSGGIPSVLVCVLGCVKFCAVRDRCNGRAVHGSGFPFCRELQPPGGAGGVVGGGLFFGKS